MVEIINKVDVVSDEFKKLVLFLVRCVYPVHFRERCIHKDHSNTFDRRSLG